MTALPVGRKPSQPPGGGTSSTTLVLEKLKSLNLPPSPPARRRGVPPPGVSRHHRHAADGRRGAGVSGRRLARQARQADRVAADPAGVRGLLGLQVVGPAAGQQPQAQAGRTCGPTTTGCAGRWRTTRRGTSSPAGRHRHRRHAGERGGQLLPPARRPDQDGRDRQRGVPGHERQLRQVPQPPDGEVDQRPVLRHGQPVRPRADQERPGAERGDGNFIVFSGRRGRFGAAADRQAAAAAPLDGDGRPRSTSTGDRREAFADWLVCADNPYFSRADRQPRLGQLHGRGPGRGGRRHAQDQPRQQRGAAGGAVRLPGRAALRPQGADAD